VTTHTAFKVARGGTRISVSVLCILLDFILVLGPWVWGPAAAGIGFWIIGWSWWIGSAMAVGFVSVVAADDGKGFTLDAFTESIRREREAIRARARCRLVRREWRRLVVRAGWATKEDVEKKRPVPTLRTVQRVGGQLLVSFRPKDSTAPREYPALVEDLRRTLHAHSADWRPVPEDPGTLLVSLGTQALPEHVAGVIPVVGQNPDPPPGPGASAVQQAPTFTLGVGTGGAPVTWSLWEAPHMLISGATGSGKGGVVRQIVLGAFDAGMHVIAVDGKEAGGEFRWIEDRGGTLIHMGPEAAADHLGVLEDELIDRGTLLYRAGVERWQDLPDLPEGFRPILLVVDEAPELLLLRKVPTEKDADAHRSMFGSRLTRLVGQGRAVGIHTVVSLQRADASLLGPAGGYLRMNLPAKVAVGTLDLEGADMMFGTGGRDTALAYLDGTPGRAVASGLTRGMTAPTPLQVAYTRAVDLRTDLGRAA
jgi:hypothetical protein